MIFKGENEKYGFHRNFGLRFTYGNFFHFHYRKGSGNPDQFQNDFLIRKPEISGTIFRNSETFQKIPVYGKIVPKFSGKRYRKNVKNILNLCKR